MIVVPKTETISACIEVKIQQFTAIRLSYILDFIVVSSVPLNLDASFDGANEMAVSKVLDVIGIRSTSERFIPVRGSNPILISVGSFVRYHEIPASPLRYQSTDSVVVMYADIS